MNRRTFVQMAAAGLAAFPRELRGLSVRADKYDLLIKGGRVVDPFSKVDDVRDVAISGGRIAAVSARIDADAGETVDARGKVVVPGLLDIHTHVGRSAEGPGMVLKDGVTGWI